MDASSFSTSFFPRSTTDALCLALVFLLPDPLSTPTSHWQTCLASGPCAVRNVRFGVCLFCWVWFGLLETVSSPGPSAPTLQVPGFPVYTAMSRPNGDFCLTWDPKDSTEAKAGPTNCQERISFGECSYPEGRRIKCQVPRKGGLSAQKGRSVC